MANLFESVQLGSLVLANRVFMAALTRRRAAADGVPSELGATYYSQRASAGLIVTEATQISPMGKGYINTPGIHSLNRCECGAESWKPFIRAEAESSFSCGMSVELLSLEQLENLGFFRSEYLPPDQSVQHRSTHRFCTRTICTYDL